MDYHHHCTPRLKICKGIDTEFMDPFLKLGLPGGDYYYDGYYYAYENWALKGFSQVAKTNYRDVATNARVALVKMGSNTSEWGDDLPVHKYDLQVSAINPNRAINFDLPAWLDSTDDLDTQSDPSQISGDDVHLNFHGSVRGNTAIGGTNADWFKGYGGRDVFFGGDGDDYMEGNQGNDELHGEGGNDFIKGGYGLDVIMGGDGDDQLLGQGDDDTIDGGLGNDRIWGGLGDDTITDMDGDNLIYGNDPDNSKPYVDTDNDTITTGAGNDEIHGQDGDDVIDAGDGDNQVSGGDGNDTITTGSGMDQICGGDDKDKVLAGSGDDKIKGDDGNDNLKGQGGDDIILGGRDNDKLRGNGGDDELAGEKGDDKMWGGGGDDTLWFGKGTDIGNGGSGDDAFKFDDHHGRYDDLGKNLIEDFEQDFYGNDTIDFKCVKSLTHLVVVATGEDMVKMIGYSGEVGDEQYRRKGSEKIFEVYVEGDDVGVIDGTEGILMQDGSYYDQDGAPVCLNGDVLVDIGNRGDWDFAGIPAGGDTDPAPEDAIV